MYKFTVKGGNFDGTKGHSPVLFNKGHKEVSVKEKCRDAGG